MFTSVPQEAYEVAMETLAKIDPLSCDPPMPSLHYMGKLLKLVLYRNAFEFNGKHFLQISGTPMGLRSSPSLSCLVVNKLVQRILEMDRHILSFHIYMDDSLLMWSGSQLQLQNFISAINKLHPTLKFTYVASDNEIQFLDLVIYKGTRFGKSNILDVICFTKPTETWCYLHRSSCHSPSVFRGFIKGELIRYARNCNNVTSFEKKKQKFTNKLLARGYDILEIEATSKEVDFNNRKAYITEKEKHTDVPLVFKIQHFPHITTKHIKKSDNSPLGQDFGTSGTKTYLPRRTYHRAE